VAAKAVVVTTGEIVAGRKVSSARLDVGETVADGPITQPVKASARITSTDMRRSSRLANRVFLLRPRTPGRS